MDSVVPGPVLVGLVRATSPCPELAPAWLAARSVPQAAQRTSWSLGVRSDPVIQRTRRMPLLRLLAGRMPARLGWPSTAHCDLRSGTQCQTDEQASAPLTLDDRGMPALRRRCAHAVVAGRPVALVLREAPSCAARQPPSPARPWPMGRMSLGAWASRKQACTYARCMLRQRPLAAQVFSIGSAVPFGRRRRPRRSRSGADAPFPNLASSAGRSAMRPRGGLVDTRSGGAERRVIQAEIARRGRWSRGASRTTASNSGPPVRVSGAGPVSDARRMSR